MQVVFEFIGRAEPLAELYEGVASAPFAAMARQPDTPGWCPLPGIGDLLTLGMHPRPDMRVLRCTGRHFHFDEAGSPSRVVLELDMP